MLHEQLGIMKVRFTLSLNFHVNCYAVKGTNGWYLVDTGLSSEDTIQMWLGFFKKQSISPSDIKGIYITHFHSDHYGCSGWLQKYTGAPVYLGAIDAYRINHYWKNGIYFLENTHDLLKQNGMPEDELKQIMDVASANSKFSFPHAELTILQAGQIIRLGDNDYQVVLTPGHTDGHICFYNEEHGVLISGDHLLPKITSNISKSAQPDADPNPLDNYLQSLNNIRSLNCKLILPAHGKPFSNFENRISQLETHHRERLELMKNLIGSGSTAYNVCRKVFTKDLTYQDLRSAMTETLAHLVYLVYRGDLEVVSTDQIKIYRLKE